MTQTSLVPAVIQALLDHPDCRPERLRSLRFVRGRIGAYKAPKSVEFIERLPRNASGKILRRELRALHRPKGDDGNRAN